MARGAQDHLDRERRPNAGDEHVRLLADVAYRVVRETTAPTPEGGRVEVVTSWLGTDQGVGVDDAPPLIFGTVVRDTVGDAWRDELEHIHATEDEALAYHERLLAEVTIR